MKVRGDIFNARRTALLSGVFSVAIGSVTGALAADAPVVTAVPAEPGWYFNGGMEVGARFFIERPPSGFGRAPPPDNWLTPRTTDSIAKFEEYGAVPRGVYLDWLRLQSGSNDGQYVVNFWARNIGRNNQEYLGDFYKVGEHYLTLGWNQIPHLISTSAKTVFSGAGSTFLSVNDSLQANLQANLPNATASGAAGTTARNNIENFINAAAGPVTLSTQRDKATVDYRYTPTNDLDFKLKYSHEHRTGTRPVGISWAYAAAPASPGFAGNTIEAIQPIDDTTQNIKASAQYTTSTPWGKNWTGLVNYAGSRYDNSLKFLEAENPFCITCTVVAPLGLNRGPNLLRLALPPSNYVNVIGVNSALDMPGQSRLTNTIQYNMMRQNDPFVSTAINGLVPAPFPASSANAKINTLLVNNVLTTQWSKDVKSTFRYRYYDLDNNTPELQWTNYVQSDGAIAATKRRNLALAYTKQNASAEINWRASKDVALGAIYGWEQWDRTRRDVNVTNEHQGKIYGDANLSGLWDGGRARASILYAVRRYNSYDAEAFVEDPAGGVFSENLAAVRKFDLANRDRLKGEAFVDIPVNSFATVTPTAGFRNDDYPIDVVNQLGVSKDHGWNAGVEIGAVFGPAWKTMFAYNYEERRLEMTGCCGGAPGGLIPANIWGSTINQRYHTFIAAVDWKAIPQTLEFKTEYVFAFGSEANDTRPCSSGNNGCTGGGVGVTTTQFPTERNQFHRLSVLGKYFVDPDIVRQLGWTGEVVAKVRYVYERNRNTNWATDNMTPYIPTADQTTDLTGGGRSLFLAAINPNYTAQFIAASLALKW